MFSILRRFTPLVEEYSIDEAFADLSGCGDVLGCPLETVAERLRNAVSGEMGLTVSGGDQPYQDPCQALLEVQEAQRADDPAA